MSRYVKAADRESTPEEDIYQLRRQVNKLKGIVEQMGRFIRAVGFKAQYTRGYFCMSYFYSGLRQCSCGWTPTIGEETTNTGMWYVICDHCLVHTESFKRIKDAILAWNAGKFTELSKLTQRPITKDTMDTNGARYVVTQMAKNAASEYKYSVRAGHPDKNLENWFEGVYFAGRPATEVLKEDAMKEQEEEKEAEEDEEF